MSVYLFTVNMVVDFAGEDIEPIQIRSGFIYLKNALDYIDRLKAEYPKSKYQVIIKEIVNVVDDRI